MKADIIIGLQKASRKNISVMNQMVQMVLVRIMTIFLLCNLI